MGSATWSAKGEDPEATVRVQHQILYPGELRGGGAVAGGSVQWIRRQAAALPKSPPLHNTILYVKQQMSDRRKSPGLCLSSPVALVPGKAVIFSVAMTVAIGVYHFPMPAAC